MTAHNDMIREAKRAYRAAQAARRRANEALVRIQFPSRPRPVYIALGLNDFNIVETGDDGELMGIVIPFRRPS